MKTLQTSFINTLTENPPNYPCFISGYVKREDGASILIVFGKSKEET